MFLQIIIFKPIGWAHTHTHTHTWTDLVFWLTDCENCVLFGWRLFFCIHLVFDLYLLSLMFLIFLDAVPSVSMLQYLFFLCVYPCGHLPAILLVRLPDYLKKQQQVSRQWFFRSSLLPNALLYIYEGSKYGNKKHIVWKTVMDPRWWRFSVSFYSRNTNDVWGGGN